MNLWNMFALHVLCLGGDMEDDMTTLATVALAVIGFMQTFIFIASHR